LENCGSDQKQKLWQKAELLTGECHCRQVTLLFLGGASHAYTNFKGSVPQDMTSPPVPSQLYCLTEGGMLGVVTPRFEELVPKALGGKNLAKRVCRPQREDWEPV